VFKEGRREKRLLYIARTGVFADMLADELARSLARSEKPLFKNKSLELYMTF
jgi:hypothetical protein